MPTPDKTFTPKTDREYTALHFGEWLGRAHERDELDSLRQAARALVSSESPKREAALAFLAWCDQREADLRKEINREIQNILESLVGDGMVETVRDGGETRYRTTRAGVAYIKRYTREGGL